MGRKQFEELVPFQYVYCLIGFRHGHSSESVKNCNGPGSESQGGPPGATEPEVSQNLTTDAGLPLLYRLTQRVNRRYYRPSFQRDTRGRV